MEKNNKKNVIVLSLLALLILPLVAMSVKADTTIPVDLQISADFTSSTAFTLQFPNGAQRYFTWNASQMHADETWTQTIYYTLNESKYCVDTLNSANSYKNLTTSLTKMLDICGSAVLTANRSESIYKELSTVTTERAEYERLWQIEVDKRAALQNQTDLLNTQALSYKRDLDGCKAQVSSIQADTAAKNQCLTDLDKEKKSKTTTALFAAAAGLLIGYFLWGKKKHQGPSEQGEAGSDADSAYNRGYYDQPGR